MTEKAIAYYRVSTQKQGTSGLGLDAQRESVTSYAKGRYTIAAEFTEIESGKKTNRAELTKALAKAKELGAVLLIAKLDRLSRNVAFTASLMDATSKGGVRFVACDMPNANDTTIGIYAVMAQDEAKRISERTKAALKAAKARGTELGTPENLTDNARAMGRQAMVKAAKAEYKPLYGYVSTLRNDMGLTLAKIAERLNEEGNTTRNGQPFQPMTVKRILDRGK